MSDSLFNQLLAKGYRITFTATQVMYTTSEGESRTIQYTGDFDSVLEAISNNKSITPDDNTITNLCARIVNNFQNPWEGVLMLTLPYDGGLIKIGPAQALGQNKDMLLSFEGIKDVEGTCTKIAQLLQPYGLHGSWVMFAKYPTMMITPGWSTQTASSGPMPFGA